MTIEIHLIEGGWKRALNAARFTQHKEPTTGEPSFAWKRKALICQHSPIRLVEYEIIIKDAPYASIMHLVRHHNGIEKFVATSRPDITGEPVSRHEQRKDDPTDAMFVCNAQALINISRLRLCNCAEAETRQIWREIKQRMQLIDPAMYRQMQPSCVERNGLCPEMKKCAFCTSKKCAEAINEYYSLD